MATRGGAPIDALERKRRVLRLLDPRRLLDHPHLGELRPQLLEIAAAGEVLRELAHGDDRRRVAHVVAPVDDRRRRRRARASGGSSSARTQRGSDAARSPARLRARRRPCRARPRRRRSAPGRRRSAIESSAYGCEDAVRAARPALRPLRRAALVRPGPALAALPRLAHRRRADRHRARRRHRDGARSRSSSCARRTATSSASTRAPEMLDDGPRRRARRRGEKIRLEQGDARSLPFEDGAVRRADVHLPPALRRRPGRDAARAGARRAPGRDDRRARVRRARAASGGRSGSCGCASGCRRPGG